MRYAERAVRRLVSVLDALCARLYGAAWNPIHQSGTVAVAMLLVLIGTGLYLVLFYRVGSPAESVARMAADPFLGSWMRSLHRYSSDVFIVAAVLHLIRMFGQGRSWGPRTAAWLSGLTLLGAGVVCAWTGFVMAWDTFGERLARDGARLLDVVPVFSEPLSRIFAGDRPVPSAFFFVNLFAHIGIPLAMGVILWVHVSRVARPTLLPPRRVTWAITGALTVLSVLMPATLGPPADAFRIASTTPTDLFAAWWLPLSEQLSPAAAWGSGLALALLLCSVPLFARRRREGALAPSMVDPRLCTGCNQCPQDCPWEAITMVERDDDRPTLVALVDPARCVSCGICAGSCAPMGVGPPGRTGRDQLIGVRDELVNLPRPAPIVAICCAQAPSSHVEAIRARGAHIRTVTCAGNLHSSVVELLIRDGVPGVIVFGCPPRDCIGREGPKWLAERLFNGREAELKARVDRLRVRVGTLAVGELDASLAAFDSFARDVAALYPPVGEAEVEIDLLCELEPVEVDS